MPSAAVGQRHDARQMDALAVLQASGAAAMGGGCRAGGRLVAGLAHGRNRQGRRGARGENRCGGGQSSEGARVAGGGQSCGRRPTSACTGARAARCTSLLRCCRPRPVMRVRWASFARAYLSKEKMTSKLFHAMETRTLRAHFDGNQILLDEPIELEPNTELLVT